MLAGGAIRGWVMVPNALMNEESAKRAVGCSIVPNKLQLSRVDNALFVKTIDCEIL